MGYDPGDAQKAASLYISMGWYPIPLRPNTKECKDSDWRDRIYTEDEFAPDDNIGIRLVKESDARKKKVIGVDLDADEAVPIAQAFLPDTDAFWGRESKAISQLLYLSPFERPVVYKDMGVTDEKKQTLVEIRVDHQSMAPPSVHPNGERLTWGRDSIIATEVDPKVLKRGVQMLATAALIARYYPPAGARHEWCLALAGSLKLFGLTEEETVLIVTQAAKSYGGEGKIKDRQTEIRTTFSRADDEPLAGMNKLVETMGEDRGKKFVESLRKIWAEKSPFRTDTKGQKILARDQANIRRALEKMGVKLWSNEFSNRIIVQVGTDRPRTIDDDITARLWLELDAKFHFLPPRDFFETVIRDAAKMTPVHPVLEYLDNLKWDGKPRLDTWLCEYGGARDNEYVRTVGRLVLLAAVKRVRVPGVKFDQLMVLESSQGKNKSTMLRMLTPNEDWFGDDLPLGVDSKLVIERTSGKWIIEAQELMNIRKAQVEHLKSFLSRGTDGPVRMAYDRNSREIRRQFIIIGTTNAEHYLKDPTGNRRFWPVRVKMFDLNAIEKNRDQLWAEAARREADGESIVMSSHLWSVAGKQQDERRLNDPWEEPLLNFLDGLDHDKEGRQRVDPEDIWKLLNIAVDKRDERAAERIGSILQSQGFRRMSIRVDKKVMRGWGRDLVDGIWRPGGWDG